MGEMIEFACPGRSTASGWLERCADEAAPGMVVLQEWWGLNEQIKGVTKRLRAAGYHALAPDLYHGRVTQDPDEAGHMMTGLDWVGATEIDVRGAIQYLRANGAKAGTLGFCMGGALTVIAGVKIPELDAAVCYYGIPPLEAADPRAMAAAFQGHFATRDSWCTPDAAADLEKGLEDSSIEYEIYHYEAEHAFFNEEEVDIYHAPSASLSWERTLSFLRRHLRP